jgi:hypothetical protein
MFSKIIKFLEAIQTVVASILFLKKKIKEQRLNDEVTKKDSDYSTDELKHILGR